jgi:membrane-bound serine protease (ClpP class)
MVDPAVEVPGLVESGELLTLTTTEAQTWGYADGVASTRDEVLAAVGLAGAPVIETDLDLAERIVRFVTDPVVASLLMIVGLLLIVGDFLVEGVGIPAAVGAGLIALFFFGHLLAGLAGWEDVALVILGLVLIGVELFVIPGFGVAGVLGVLALLGGMFLAMVGRDVRTPQVTEQALWTVLATFAGLVIGLFAIVLLLPHGSRFRGLVLTANVGDAAPASKPATVRKPGGWLRLFGGTSALERDRERARSAGSSGSDTSSSTPPPTLTKRTGVTLTD